MYLIGWTMSPSIPSHSNAWFLLSNKSSTKPTLIDQSLKQVPLSGRGGHQQKKTRKGLLRLSQMKARAYITLTLRRRCKKSLVNDKRRKRQERNHREKEEEELIVREHRTKKKHEQTGVSYPACPTREKIAPQRLKDLNETDDEEEDNVKVVLQSKKAISQVVPTPKTKKIAKATPATKEIVIPSFVPRRVKTRFSGIKLCRLTH